MQYQIVCRSKGRKTLIDSLVRVLIPELKLTRSRFNLIIKSQRGLIKQDGMRGVVGPDPSDPTQLVMLLDSALDSEFLISTLCHEMVHVKQLAKGQMKFLPNDAKIWKGKRYNKKTKYLDMPWELDAFSKQEILLRRAIEIDNK